MKSKQLINSLPVIQKTAKSTYHLVMTTAKKPSRSFVSDTQGVTEAQLKAHVEQEITNNTTLHYLDSEIKTLNQKVNSSTTEQTLTQAKITDTLADIAEEVHSIKEWTKTHVSTLNESTFNKSMMQNFVNFLGGGCLIALGFSNYKLSQQVAKLETAQEPTSGPSIPGKK